jgi:hypothetical protein
VNSTWRGALKKKDDEERLTSDFLELLKETSENYDEE